MNFYRFYSVCCYWGKLLVFLCLIGFGACENDPGKIDKSNITHRWEVLDKGQSDKIHLMEFHEDGHVEFASDINLYSGLYYIKNDGRISIFVSKITDKCCDSAFTEDLVKSINNSTSYRVLRDSLLLKGVSEILTKRLPDCGLIGCQKDFKSIGISVKYGDGSPARLSSYKIFRLPDKKDITPFLYPGDFTSGQSVGGYTVTNDSYTPYFDKRNVEIQFQGKIDNAVVAERNISSNLGLLSRVFGFWRFKDSFVNTVYF